MGENQADMAALAATHSAQIRPLPLIAFITGLALTGTSSGQDEPLTEILVTGSRITRAAFESMSPIVSVPQEAFEQTGSTSRHLPGADALEQFRERLEMIAKQQSVPDRQWMIGAKRSGKLRVFDAVIVGHPQQTLRGYEAKHSPEAALVRAAGLRQRAHRDGFVIDVIGHAQYRERA
jgi:hypothetical protein